MTSTTCCVCDEPLGQPNVATCNACGQDYHLQVRMDIPGKDCGAVWLHEEHAYLEFGCRLCLEDAGPQVPAAAIGT